MKKIILIFLSLHTIQLNGQITVDTNSLKKILLYNEELINTENLEFCPSSFHDYILIVKSNEDGEKDENTDDYYTDLVYIAKDAKGRLSKTALLPQSINTDMYEGQCAFDATNGKLYFTRSYYDRDRKNNKDSIVLKIYETSDKNKFSKVEALSFCNDKYSVCHPTISRNGERMIFSSNMSGSDQMDLYETYRINNSWSTPLKLNKTINSSHVEIFPYLYKDSLLFFSSNRATGMGGLDIFYSSLSDTGWVKPMALPYPINSSFDDLGIMINEKNNGGYISSNRPGGKGKDDIYKFETEIAFVKKIESNIELTCGISPINKLSFEKISNFEAFVKKINVSDLLQQEAQKIQITKNGGEIIFKMENEKLPEKTILSKDEETVFVSLKSNETYLITIKAPEFEEEHILYNPANHGSELTVVMNPKETIKEETKFIKEENVPLIIPTEVGSIVVFNNIYYEYNSTEIKLDAAEELEVLYTAMIENENMKVQLSAHTDSRGNSLYNKQLSEKRALSAKSYLTKKGINSSRINIIGFGESRIRNHCTDGVSCSEEDHLFNRRTEVLIIE